MLTPVSQSTPKPIHTAPAADVSVWRFPAFFDRHGAYRRESANVSHHGYPLYRVQGPDPGDLGAGMTIRKYDLAFDVVEPAKRQPSLDVTADVLPQMPVCEAGKVGAVVTHLVARLADDVDEVVAA